VREIIEAFWHPRLGLVLKFAFYSDEGVLIKTQLRMVAVDNEPEAKLMLESMMQRNGQ
jgi:hypothetical protein